MANHERDSVQEQLPQEDEPALLSREGLKGTLRWTAEALAQNPLKASWAICMGAVFGLTLSKAGADPYLCAELGLQLARDYMN